MPPLASRQHIRSERNRFRRAQEGQIWSIKDLPKFYYHSIFCAIIDEIEAELPHLLNSEALAFIDDFRRLPFPAQCAYIRMAGRKGFIFNIEKFSYPEIQDMTGQWNILSNANFIENLRACDSHAYFKALTKPELCAILQSKLDDDKFKKSWSKDKLISVAINELVFDRDSISETHKVQSRTTALKYIFYLYSGQVEASLQNLTLRDLGLVKSPKPKRPFAARFDNKEDAVSAFFYADGLHEFRQQNQHQLDYLRDRLPEWPIASCTVSTALRDKLLYKLGGLSERQGDINAALSLYSHSDTPLCNERVIRLRYKNGDRAWVKSRLKEIIEDPSSDDEHNFAQDFYARKFNKKRTSTVTDILRKSQCLTLDEAYKHQPELAVIQHFQNLGLTCFRTENTLWRNLFGLLFWDELFDNTKNNGKRRNSNSHPFYTCNREQVEQKLGNLNTPKIVIPQLLKTLAKNHGTYQKYVNWRSAESFESICALIETSPKDALSHMIREMAKDWTNTKDGFPDVMIIENNICRFVEIKAAGDVIRRNQLTRMQQLRKAGFTAEILKVSWNVDPDQTYVVVDVETTGGRPGLHRVTEIGAVKVKGGTIIDKWSNLINPQRSIPANITRITGISNDMVEHAPIFAEVADSFASFMGNAIFAAHNVNFDYGFISAEFQMIDRHFSHPKICTCASMRQLFPGHASYSLKNLCRDFDINLDNHHRALCDAEAAAELLFLVNSKRLEA